MATKFYYFSPFDPPEIYLETGLGVLPQFDVIKATVFWTFSSLVDAVFDRVHVDCSTFLNSFINFA